jgi:lysozyme
MMADDLTALRQQLVKHEGLKLKPYRDTKGNWTIGVGRNLTTVGISELEAMDLLDNDITTAIGILVSSYPWFEGLAPMRQRVIVDMMFNLGPGGFAQFTSLIADLSDGNFSGAAREIIASKAAMDAPSRYHTLSTMMLNGEVAA